MWNERPGWSLLERNTIRSLLKGIKGDGRDEMEMEVEYGEILSSHTMVALASK